MKPCEAGRATVENPGEIPPLEGDVLCSNIALASESIHGLHRILSLSQISKDLVDLQIETNKMKERYETENFELKNTVSTFWNSHFSPANTSIQLCSSCTPTFALLGIFSWP